MSKKILKTLIYLAILPKTVAELLFILFILFELTDPINVGYLPSETYVLFGLQVIAVIIQAFLFYFWRKFPKKVAMVLILGGLISFILFAYNFLICLSVKFS